MMKWKELIKLVKLLKSSQKGVAGLSKTIVGALIIILGAFGLEPIAGLIKGQEVQISEALKQLLEAAGTLLVIWGKIASNIELDKAREGTGNGEATTRST